MPNVTIYDAAGAQVGDLALNDAVFGIDPHVPSMHLVVRSYLAAQRRGTQSTLTRGEVRGGGKKPWRQKGTGRARQGSTRSPQWTHGGIAFGPKPRDYVINVNRKVRRLAMKSALSSKVRDDELTVLSALPLEEIKTREVAKALEALKAGKKTLIVSADADNTLYRSARNIEGVKVSPVNNLTVYDILNCDTLLLLQDAVGRIEEIYAPAEAGGDEEVTA